MSPEDYQECVKHRWRWKPSGKGSSKHYLVRNKHINWENGGHAKDNRTQQDYFLHTFILEVRIGQPRPSARHICDHRDSNEGNCRRENLRWTTKRFNAMNLGGRYSSKEFDDAAVFAGSRAALAELIKSIKERCGMTGDKLIDIEAEKQGESAAAFRLFDGKVTAWVPKTEVEDNGDGTYTMPVWLATEKGFV